KVTPVTFKYFSGFKAIILSNSKIVLPITERF
ncbi:hypothetical protein D039_5179B, partial [Vibrio parahaemolyticus EKP-028]